MRSTDGNLWHDLKVGDRIQTVHLPFEFAEHEYTLHDETRNAYQNLIESKAILAISKIDDDAYPWVDFEIVNEHGQVEYHSLMLNHDGIQRVVSDGE
jgi:hypothetical protein